MDINMKMSKSILLVILLVLGLNAAHAVSQTGLSSSLIKEWHSEVDRVKCPDFRYPSHPPSIVTGEKVYKANCASCHGASPNKSTEIVNSMRKTSPEKHFETVCAGTHNFAKTLTIDERWDSLFYMNTQILGYYPLGSAEAAKMDATFGGNCAICHGTRGQGDGNLHKMLLPPPANLICIRDSILGLMRNYLMRSLMVFLGLVCRRGRIDMILTSRRILHQN